MTVVSVPLQHEAQAECPCLGGLEKPQAATWQDATQPVDVTAQTDTDT